MRKTPTCWEKIEAEQLVPKDVPGDKLTVTPVYVVHHAREERSKEGLASLQSSG